MMRHLKSLSYFLLNQSYRRIIVICWLDIIDNYLLQKMQCLPCEVLITAEIQLTTFASRVKLCPTIRKKNVILLIAHN